MEKCDIKSLTLEELLGVMEQEGAEGIPEQTDLPVDP